MILPKFACHEMGHARYIQFVFGKSVKLECLSRATINGGCNHFRVTPTEAYLADVDAEAGCLLAGAVAEAIYEGECVTIQSINRHSDYGSDDFKEVLEFVEHGWVRPTELDSICADAAQVVRPAIDLVSALQFSMIMDRMRPGESQLLETIR